MCDIYNWLRAEVLYWGVSGCGKVGSRLRSRAEEMLSIVRGERGALVVVRSMLGRAGKD